MRRVRGLNRRGIIRQGACAIVNGTAITKWNLAALIALLIGGGSTLVLDQLWLQSWLASGLHIRVGQRTRAELPAGRHLVYYESLANVPTGNCTLSITDRNGDRVQPLAAEQNINYRMILAGWSGRALWQMDIQEPGVYELLCHNHNFLSNDTIPLDDRVVLLRQPRTLTEATTVQSLIRVTGGTLTFVAVLILYLLHGLALRKRRSQKNRPKSPEL